MSEKEKVKKEIEEAVELYYSDRAAFHQRVQRLREEYGDALVAVVVTQELRKIKEVFGIEDT